MKTVLTIAGSDCSGGAGIQADIKAIMANGAYAMSVITALTAQNTMGVYNVLDIPVGFVAEQMDAVFTDIRPDAVKIGMVSNSEIIHIIADKLLEYKAENIVVDTVMVSTSGSKLLKDDAVDALKSRLLPIADVITPNIPEAEILSAVAINSKADMLFAAKAIRNYVNCNILIKGGHCVSDADDLLYRRNPDEEHWFIGERIHNENTHGTGCTLSSAIATNLALGHSMEVSIGYAKQYISAALKDGMDLGKGSGPLNHAVTFFGKA